MSIWNALVGLTCLCVYIMLKKDTEAFSAYKACGGKSTHEFCQNVYMLWSSSYYFYCRHRCRTLLFECGCGCWVQWMVCDMIFSCTRLTLQLHIYIYSMMGMGFWVHIVSFYQISNEKGKQPKGNAELKLWTAKTWRTTSYTLENYIHRSHIERATEREKI